MLHIFSTINASLNALAGILLFLGWRAIKAKNKELHKKFMLAAFTTSIFFLGSYITYHALKRGVVTHYQEEGILKFIYFFILGTHTPLAILIVPLSVLAIRFAYRNDFKNHVRITKWLYPVWAYVSVTGVLIYFMLYIF